MSNYDEYNDNNIYYDPKKWGLVPLISLDIAGDYEFDIFAIWFDPKDKEKCNGLYYANDSGCSCPSPFSAYTKLSDLQFSNREEEILASINAWGREAYEKHDISSLKTKVREYFDKE